MLLPVMRIVESLITEPDTGSDLHALQVKAMPIDGGYRLKGVKMFNARIFEATHYIVFANVIRNDFTTLPTAFLIDVNTNGIVRKPIDTMGLHSVSFGMVELNDVYVSLSDRLGGEGQAISLFINHFSYWRLMMSAAVIGSAQAALGETRDHLRKRNAFGGPIGRFTHLQQDLALHITRLRTAWLLCTDTALRLDAKLPITFDAAMVKADAVDAAISAVDWSLRVHGAKGYTKELTIEKRLRDLIGLRTADGTGDVLRGQVARSFLGNDMYDLSLGRLADDNHSADVPLREYWT